MSLNNAGVERREQLFEQRPYQLCVPLLEKSTPHNQPLYTAHHQQQNPNYAYRPPTYQNADPFQQQHIRDTPPWQQPPDPPDWQRHPKPPPYGFHDIGTTDLVTHGCAVTATFGAEHYAAPAPMALPHTWLYTEPYGHRGEQRPLPRLEPEPDPSYGLNWFGPRDEQPPTIVYGQPTYTGFESSVCPRNPRADSHTRPPDYLPPWPITNEPDPSDQSWYSQAVHQPWQAEYQSAPPPPEPIGAMMDHLLSKLANLERRWDESERRTARKIWAPPLPEPDLTYNPTANDSVEGTVAKMDDLLVEASFELAAAPLVEEGLSKNVGPTRSVELKGFDGVEIFREVEFQCLAPSKSPNEEENCSTKGDIVGLQVEHKLQNEPSDMKKVLEELKREYNLKSRECHEAWNSLSELQNELMRKSMLVGSLTFAIESQVQDKGEWFSSLRDLTGKLKILKMEQVFDPGGFSTLIVASWFPP